MPSYSFALVHILYAHPTNFKHCIQSALDLESGLTHSAKYASEFNTPLNS